MARTVDRLAVQVGATSGESTSSRAEIACADARLCVIGHVWMRRLIDLSTIARRRQLIAASAAKLREGGKVVSMCTLQAALRQHLGVEMTLREIIDARRSR